MEVKVKEANGLENKVHQITRKLVALFKEPDQKDALLQITGDDEKSLDNLVKASAATLLIEDFAIEYPGENPLDKKRNMYRELKTLFGDVISDGIRVRENIMAFYSNIFDLMLNTPKIKLLERESKILDTFEDDLIEIFRFFPEYYFFDFLEGLVDIGNTGDSTGGEGTDQDLLSFNKFRQDIIEFLRIDDLKDLEVLYIPIKKLTEKIYAQALERMPISARGVDAFYRSNILKNDIVTIFKESMEENRTLDEIESMVLDRIKKGLQEEAESSANRVTYFLQYLLDLEFSSLMELLERNGIENIPLFTSALTMDYREIKDELDEKEIKLEDINRLKAYDGGLASFVRLSLEDFKEELRSRQVDEEDLARYTVEAMIKDHLSDIENPALEFVATDMNLSQGELVEMLLMEVNIKDFLLSIGVKSMDQLLMVLKMEEFIENITHEIFLSLLVGLTKQVARIIEFFLMLETIRAGMLDNIKHFKETVHVKAWQIVQAQDGFIKQLMRLQENVAYILDKDDPREINAFILGKLCNMTFQDAVEDIKKGKSMIYFDAVDHEIVLENVGIISRISAMDLLFRFQASNLD